MTTKLDKELQTYEAHREELLGSNRGKFVLIKGERLVGTFESQQDAIERGYEEFGNEPFLVKQILDVDVPFNFTSFLVAV